MDTHAYVATAGGGCPRRATRTAERIAAVLGEFGFSTFVAPAATDGDELSERFHRVRGASVVVCDLVRPDHDIPVEIAIAATRAIPVMALVPEGVQLRGTAAQLLGECGATLIPYSGCEPHQALDATLGRLETEHAAAA